MESFKASCDLTYERFVANRRESFMLRGPDLNDGEERVAARHLNYSVNVQYPDVEKGGNSCMAPFAGESVGVV